MTTNADSAGSGDFVIAGMTFHEEATELAHWSSGSVAAVGAVEINIGPGVTVTVDVARPAQVLAFTIQDFGDPERLVAACEADAQTLIDDAMRDGDSATTELTLRSAWARRAFVTGVARWLPRPIHEGALLLDEAAAHQAVGESVAAAQLVALGLPVLEALATDCGNGLLSKLTVLELADISRRAAEAVANLDWGNGIRELADQIAEDAGVSELGAELALLQWSESEHLAPTVGFEGALTSGFEGALTSGGVTEAVVDPAAMSPRVVAWIDARHPELHIVEATDGDEVSAELRVALSDFVDERCYEVGRVSAFVADPARGAVLRTTTTQVEEDRTLRADLRYRRPPSGRVVYGIFDADKGVSSLRYRNIDADIVAIDRLLLDAWSIHRAALVVQARIGELDRDATERARARAQSLLLGAQSLVEDASSKIAQLQGRLAGSDPAMASILAARLSAVEHYRSELEHGNNRSPEYEPLLAELLPLTSEDGVDLAQ